VRHVCGLLCGHASAGWLDDDDDDDDDDVCVFMIVEASAQSVPNELRVGESE
jgi:hypothetical protein